MERERSHLRAAEKAKRAHNQLLRDQEYVGGKLAYRNEAEFLRTLQQESQKKIELVQEQLSQMNIQDEKERDLEREHLLDQLQCEEYFEPSCDEEAIHFSIQSSQNAQDALQAAMFQNLVTTRVCPVCHDSLVKTDGYIRCVSPECRLNIELDCALSVDLDDVANKIQYYCVHQHEEESKDEMCKGARDNLAFKAKKDQYMVFPRLEDWRIYSYCGVCKFEICFPVQPEGFNSSQSK